MVFNVVKGTSLMQNNRVRKLSESLYVVSAAEKQLVALAGRPLPRELSQG